jgi:hypothetical protein
MMIESNPEYFTKDSNHEDGYIWKVKKLIDLAESVERLHLELFDAKNELNNFIHIYFDEIK